MNYVLLKVLKRLEEEEVEGGGGGGGDFDFVTKCDKAKVPSSKVKGKIRINSGDLPNAFLLYQPNKNQNQNSFQNIKLDLHDNKFSF